MTSASVWSTTLLGINGVMTQIHARIGPPPSNMRHTATPTGMTEAIDRVRAALRFSDLPWPDQRLTFEFSPTIPSAWPGVDLAMACAALSAAQPTEPTPREHTVFIGALNLDGTIRAVSGVLPALLAAQRAGITQAVVPRETLSEAMAVPGMTVLGADRLHDVAAWLRGEDHRLSPPRPQQPPATSTHGADLADLADVYRQPEAAWALEVAAAGGHSILMIGRPGTGTTMLARRLPGLLPVLSPEHALEVHAIQSIVGGLPAEVPAVTRPPFVAPHHTSSMPALLGGGGRPTRPGAVSRAHHGVLFLDEVTEFGHDRLDALCPILDEGEVRLARSHGVIRYPAKFLLALAARDCPCAAPRESDCVCSPQEKRRYLGRLSRRLLDRVDVRVRTRPVTDGAKRPAAPAEPTAIVRERVAQARQRAAERWAQFGVGTNAEVPDTVLVRDFALPRSSLFPVDRDLRTGALTFQGAQRALRVAWTLGDLAGLDRPGPAEVAAALEFRDLRPTQPEP